MKQVVILNKSLFNGCKLIGPLIMPCHADFASTELSLTCAEFAHNASRIASRSVGPQRF